MPAAFIEISGKYVLVALLSLRPGTNAFVAPDGSWLGQYIPALFRSYPFRLLRQSGTDQFSLWVDEDAEQLSDAAASTELYYDTEGKLGPVTKAVFDSLAGLEQNRLITDLGIAALAAEGAICPWQLKIKDGDTERTLGGLHRIDEQALTALSDEAFLRLRKAGALPIAYAQLMSMAQLQIFSNLEQLQRRIREAAVGRQPAAQLPSSGSGFTMVDPETLRFD